MKITTVTVSAQRKLPHPAVDFASVSGLVSLTAELQPEDHIDRCTAQLQHRAELLVEEHVASVITALRPQPVKTAAEKMQSATANTAANLAEKHAQ